VTPLYALRLLLCLLSLKYAQGEDLNVATTRINLALPPPSTAEAPRKITEEERGFEAAKALRDAKFRARHEGQRRLRAAKVIPPNAHLATGTDDCPYCSGKRKRLTRRSKPPRTPLVVYFPLFSLVLCISKILRRTMLSPTRRGRLYGLPINAQFTLNPLRLENDDEQLAGEPGVGQYSEPRGLKWEGD